MEQEVGGSSPPNCTKQNIELSIIFGSDFNCLMAEFLKGSTEVPTALRVPAMTTANGIFGVMAHPGIGPCRRIQRISKSRITSRKRAGRRALRRKAAPARPPEPSSAASPERFQRAIGIEHFDAYARPWVDVEQWFMTLFRVGSHRLPPSR